jgi:hypothetical protein
MAVATQATKYVAFGRIINPTVFSNAVAIIASDSFGMWAALSSSLHDTWAREFGGKNLLLLRYSPSDLFQTFPLPLCVFSSEKSIDDAVVAVGKQHCQLIEAVMKKNGEGLTATHNRFHEPCERSEDIMGLRAMQVEVDRAVATAYGWTDLNLDHGFHETKQGLRFTISESARRTVLDRLLALNHQRRAEEEAEKAELAVSAPVKSGRKKRGNVDKLTLDLL